MYAQYVRLPPASGLDLTKLRLSAANRTRSDVIVTSRWCHKLKRAVGPTFTTRLTASPRSERALLVDVVPFSEWGSLGPPNGVNLMAASRD